MQCGIHHHSIYSWSYALWFDSFASGGFSMPSETQRSLSFQFPVLNLIHLCAAPLSVARTSPYWLQSSIYSPHSVMMHHAHCTCQTSAMLQNHDIVLCCKFVHILFSWYESLSMLCYVCVSNKKKDNAILGNFQKTVWNVSRKGWNKT